MSRPAPRVMVIGSEPDLNDRLDQLNSAEMVYIGVNEDGGPTGRISCDNCAQQPWDWTPLFPVYVLDQVSAS